MIQNPDAPNHSSSGDRTCSIWANGQVVPGWENLNANEPGDTFIMNGEGILDYGYNAKVSGYEVAPDTLVALDYNRRLAYSNEEDMSDELVKAARHRGRLNYLQADGSVGAAGPSELDPALGNNDRKWSPQP